MIDGNNTPPGVPQGQSIYVIFLHEYNNRPVKTRVFK